MKPIPEASPGRSFLSLLLILLAMSSLPQVAAADTKAPASVAALIPAGLQIDRQDWSFEDYETENYGDYNEEDGSYGMVRHKRFSLQLHALFPKSVSCDFTVGPEFNLELQGDSVWEADPEIMKVWEQTTADYRDFESSAKSRSDFLNVHISPSAGERVIGEPQMEKLPNGHVTYIEFSWKCDKNPAGKNIWVDGYAHRGATMLTFSFWANAGRAEAAAMASEIFAKFEKLDIAALGK